MPPYYMHADQLPDSVQQAARPAHLPALVLHLVAAQVEVGVGEGARGLADQAPQEAVAAGTVGMRGELQSATFSQTLGSQAGLSMGRHADARMDQLSSTPSPAPALQLAQVARNPPRPHVSLRAGLIGPSLSDGSGSWPL